MAFSVVNIGTNSNTSGTTCVIAIPSSVPAGALIVVEVTEKASAGGSVADGVNSGNYSVATQLLANLGADGIAQMFYVEGSAALTSSNSITYTKDAGNAVAMSAFYVTGVATSGALDGSIVGGFGTSVSPNVTSGTPATAGCIFLAYVGNMGTASTFTQDSGWVTPPTAVTSGATASDRTVNGGYLVQTGSAAPETYSVLFANSKTWGALIAAFKPLSGGTQYSQGATSAAVRTGTNLTKATAKTGITSSSPKTGTNLKRAVSKTGIHSAATRASVVLKKLSLFRLHTSASPRIGALKKRMFKALASAVTRASIVTHASVGGSHFFKSVTSAATRAGTHFQHINGKILQARGVRAGSIAKRMFRKFTGASPRLGTDARLFLPLFTDNFTSAAGVDLAQTGEGSSWPWTRASGVTSGTITNTGSGSGKATITSTADAAYLTNNLGMADHYAQSKIYGTMHTANACVRVVDSNNWIGLVYSTAGSINLKKCVAGVETTVASPSYTTFTAGDLWKIQVNGTLVKVFLNGTLTGAAGGYSITDSVFTGVMTAGIVARTTTDTAILSNFQAGHYIPQTFTQALSSAVTRLATFLKLPVKFLTASRVTNASFIKQVQKFFMANASRPASAAVGRFKKIRTSVVLHTSTVAHVRAVAFFSAVTRMASNVRLLSKILKARVAWKGRPTAVTTLVTPWIKNAAGGAVWVAETVATAVWTKVASASAIWNRTR